MSEKTTPVISSSEDENEVNYFIRARREYRAKRMEAVRSVDAESLSSDSSSTTFDENTLSDIERYSAFRILIAYRCWRKREDLSRIRWAILNRLVLSLQRLYRRRKAQKEQVVEKLVTSRSIGRFQLPQLLKESNFQIPNPSPERKREKHKRVVLVDDNEPEEMQPKLVVPVTQVEVPVSATPVITPPEDKRSLSIIKIQSAIRSFIWRDCLMKMKGEGFLDEIVKSSMIADSEHPVDATGTIVDLEPVDVYVPADLNGVLDHGTVVNGPETIVGVDINATKDEEWIVDEVEDVGEFDEYEKLLDQAAVIIQRFYRRRFARYKFRQMVEEAINAAKEGRPLNTMTAVDIEGSQPTETTQADGASAASNCTVM
jgi:hypothetical protein